MKRIKKTVLFHKTLEASQIQPVMLKQHFKKKKNKIHNEKSYSGWFKFRVHSTFT